MTHRRRNLMLRVLGVGLTLGVIALDALDVLAPLENWFYDRRAALFQEFSSPPTQDLVHVDIDDSALEAIGAWPWPRSTLADIVDELHSAGATAVALDVVFSEAQPQHDARFAQSISVARNVLIPASFTPDAPLPPSPAQQAATTLLARDLELGWESVAAQLRDRHLVLGEHEFLAARAQAILQRTTEARQAGCRSVEELRKRILPQTPLAGSSLSRVVDATWNKLEVERNLARFGRPATDDAQPAARVADLQPLVPELIAASSYGGYVDLLQPKQDGGVVRSVSLWVERDGRIYPQMALSLACAAMRTEPGAIQFRKDGMVIPRPGRAELFVPLRFVRTERFGEVGMFFDVPWIGGDNWRTMYDVSRQGTTAQHLPITLAWAVADGRRKLVRNNELADETLRALAQAGYGDSVKPFVANPTPPTECDTRGRAVRAAIAELEPFMQTLAGVKPEELTDDERQLSNACDVLRTTDRQMRTFSRKAAELRDALRDKSVFIGWTATAATDNYPTAIHDRCPGVVVHGAIFNALMTGDFLHRAPFWVNCLMTLGVGLLTTMIVGWMEPWKALSLTLLLVFAYAVLNGATLFDWGNWVVGAAGPVVAGAAVWSGLTLVRFIGESKERGRITRRFGAYADPNLVRYVVEHPEMDVFEGQVRELTVVFTDLAGFTTLTEKLREKAVPILSDYMSRMVPVIQEHHGLVNKFLGDGIMFFYGAPVPSEDHAADAVTTVMQMNRVLEQFNRELTEQGNPNVAMRAGVSTGPMVVGDAGSRLRSDYTVLGDAVNLGARLESANKATGTTTMLSGRTVELLGDRFLVRPIGKLRVAGKTEGVMAFEPLARTQDATDEQRELAKLTRAMVDAYMAGKFAECLSAAEAMETQFGKSKLTELYRGLSTEFLANPPSEFDGVISLKEK